MHVVMQQPSLFASHFLCLLLNANLGLGVMAQGGFEVQFRLLLIWFRAVFAGWCRMVLFSPGRGMGCLATLSGQGGGLPVVCCV